MGNTLLCLLLLAAAAPLRAQPSELRRAEFVTETLKSRNTKQKERSQPAAKPKPAVPATAAKPVVLDRLRASAGGGAMSGMLLDRLYDNTGAGGPVPEVRVTKSQWSTPAKPSSRGTPHRPQRSRSVASIPAPPEHRFPPVRWAAPDPFGWAESFVRAIFVQDGGQVPVEYSMDELGQIIGVSVPGHGYSEERRFADGLVVNRTIRRDGSVVEIANRWNSKGVLIDKTVTGDGSLLLKPLPFAPALAELVLDWQISREDRLRIQQDTRPRDFHSPFWDGRSLNLSRGYTDPDEPKTWKRHPILGVKRPHEGIDIPKAEGTKIYPSRRGLVVASGWESGYGLRVEVQHYKDNRPDGAPEEVTVYGHLQKAYVKKGQWVTPGKDVLGLVGSTGLSTGPHLHFEVHAGGKAVDPMERLSPSMPSKSKNARAVVDPRLARTYPN